MLLQKLQFAVIHVTPCLHCKQIRSANITLREFVGGKVTQCKQVIGKLSAMNCNQIIFLVGAPKLFVIIWKSNSVFIGFGHTVTKQLT